MSVPNKTGTSWINNIRKDQLYMHCLAALLPVSENMTLDELRSIYRNYIKERNERENNEDLFRRLHYQQNVDNTLVGDATASGTNTNPNSRRRVPIVRESIFSDTETVYYSDNEKRDPPIKDQNSILLRGLKTILDEIQKGQQNTQTSSHSQISESISRDLKRWNITFSGNENESVHKFIDTVNLYKSTKNPADTTLYALIPEMLTDKALSWFIANKASISSWTTFIIELKTEFSIPGYDMKLKRDMFCRTQHKAESLSDFATIIRTMNNRLHTPLSEPELVELIKSNLNPYFSRQLGSHYFTSYRSLINWGRVIEANRFQADNYQQPPPNMVDPEFMFHAPHKEPKKDKPQPISPPPHNFHNSPQTYQQPILIPPNFSIPPPNYNANIQQRRVSFQNDQVCWNCGKIGHTFAKCFKDKTMFCHLCGKSGVTSKSCGCFKKSENQ